MRIGGKAGIYLYLRICRLDFIQGWYFWVRLVLGMDSDPFHRIVIFTGININLGGLLPLTVPAAEAEEIIYIYMHELLYDNVA